MVVVIIGQIFQSSYSLEQSQSFLQVIVHYIVETNLRPIDTTIFLVHGYSQ